MLDLYESVQLFADKVDIDRKSRILSFISSDEEHVHKFISASNITPKDYLGFQFDEVYGEEYIPTKLYGEVLRRKKGNNKFNLDKDLF